MRAFFFALALSLFTLAAHAQQQIPMGDRFIGERIAGDALTIRDLLNKLAAAEAKAADLQAQLDKRKQDGKPADAPKENP